MTPCPRCQKPVDPLRARAVGVRDGKIVAYCSAECVAEDAAADVAASVELLARRSRTPSGNLEAAISKKLARRRRDSLDAKAAWDWLDEEPAEIGIDASRTKGGLLVTVVILLAVLSAVAGGYFVYRLV